MSVSVQPYIDAIDFGSGALGWAMGSPSPSYAAVAVPFIDELQLWRIVPPVPLLVATVSASMTENAGVISACLDTLGVIRTDEGWWIVSPGSPWTVTSSALSIGGVDRLTIAGDLSCAVAQTSGGDVVGVPIDGSGSALWTCSLGSGVLLGSPRAERWLRLTGDYPTMSIDLVDDIGSTLDSISYDHPADSFPGSTGLTSAADSTVHSVPVSPGVVTMLGIARDGGPTYAVRVVHRTLTESSDVLSWNAVAAEIDAGWSDGELSRTIPWGAAADGQIAIGSRVETFA